MSGQESHEQPEQHPQEEYDNFQDLMMMASVVMPIRGSNILDYLFASGIPISPFSPGGGDDAAASILARSLYDRHPVKKVITQEAAGEIVDKEFTVAMVEELKINGMCGIWQEEFEEGEGIKILPCNHAFKADAIMKWLEEEKAECPICRFSLKSKEVIENQDQDENQDPYQNLDDSGYGDGEGNGEDDVHQQGEPAEPAQDNNDVRVNNIASRFVQSVAGRMSNLHRQLPQDYEQSISVPIRRLIESRRNLISAARNLAVSRAAMPLAGGGAAAPVSRASYANAGYEVRAEAMQSGAINANNNNNNNNNNNPNYINIINNYYYDINAMNDINNNNNNHYIVDEAHQDIVSSQEQADIQEAIRRSLE